MAYAPGRVKVQTEFGRRCRKSRSLANSWRGRLRRRRPMRAELELKSGGWVLCRVKSQGATVNGWDQVDSKFWSLARLQRAVADNCTTDDDLIRLECL